MIEQGHKPKLIVIEGIDRIGKTFNLIKNLQSPSVFNPDEWLKATDPWYSYCFFEDGALSRMLSEQEDFRYMNPQLHMWTLPSIYYNVLKQSDHFTAVVKDRWALSSIFYNRFRTASNATYAYDVNISISLERLLMTVFDVHQYVFCLSLEDANKYYDKVQDNVWSSHQLKQLNQMFLEESESNTVLPTTQIRLDIDTATGQTNILDYAQLIRIENGLIHK